MRNFEELLISSLEKYFIRFTHIKYLLTSKRKFGRKVLCVSQQNIVTWQACQNLQYDQQQLKLSDSKLHVAIIHRCVILYI